MASQSIGLCSFLMIISWWFLHTKGENCYLLYGVINKCFDCPAGYYGSACTDLCGNCKTLDYRIGNSSSTSSGTFCDWQTGKCIGGCQNSWNGDKCDVREYEYEYEHEHEYEYEYEYDSSHSCGGSSGPDYNGECQECDDGYYGQVCAYRCSDECKYKCEIRSGVCYECNPGYYGFDCHSTCENCMDGLCDRIDGICSECKHGFHGPNCNKTCGQCQPDDGHLSDLGRCNRVTSICDNGCRTGFHNEDCYKSDMGRYCYTSHTGSLQCSDCPVGTYGDNCEEACSSQCAMTEYIGRFCEKVSGKCFGCDNGLLGDRCECKGFCDEKGCNETEYCYDCVAGYYGYSCLHQCGSSCDNNGCNQDGQCYKCLPGYYGRNCYYKCKLQCKDGRCNIYDGLCSDCPTGLYGEYCNQTCGQCARVSGVTFETPRCDRYTGTCFSGCIEGYIGETCHESNDGRFCYNLTSGTDLYCFNCPVDWYGGNCDQKCHEHCVVTEYLGRICDQDLGECAKCENGWYGSKCDCRGHCNSEGCDTNGICFGCEFGYWGQQYCLLECSEGCDDKGCNDVNGLCYSCNSKRYGNYCNLTCSNCHQNCNRITGACLEGCAVGFYGHGCGVNCSHCTYMHVNDVDDSNIPCDLTSGYCKDGCVLGHYGLRCNKPCECDNKECDRYTGACRDGYASGFSEPTSGTSPDLTKNENYDTFKDENDDTFKNENDDTFKNENDDTFKNENDDTFKNENDDTFKNENDDTFKNENDDTFKNENDDTFKNENYDTFKNENDHTFKNENDDTFKNENDHTFKNENDHTFKNENDHTFKNENDHTFKNENDDTFKDENDETFKDENDDTFKNEKDVTFKNENDYTYIGILAVVGMVTGFVNLVFLTIIIVISGRYAKTWRSVSMGKQKDITGELDPLWRQGQHYDELNITRKAVDASTNNVYGEENHKNNP